MFNIAVVEDDNKEAETLISCLKKYGLEYQTALSIERFKDAFSFLESNGTFDLIFMDIMMPGMNGMEAAQKLRAKEIDTPIIFETNIAQFAVEGYEVGAIDYILKPVQFERLKKRLIKFFDSLENNSRTCINIKSEGNLHCLSSQEIYYVEVKGHEISYMTKRGCIRCRGVMKEIEKNLHQYGFLRCNACYLVNIDHITSIKGLSIIMRNGDEVRISQPKKKEFMQEMAIYFAKDKM